MQSMFTMTGILYNINARTFSGITFNYDTIVRFVCQLVAKCKFRNMRDETAIFYTIILFDHILTIAYNFAKQMKNYKR